MMEERMYTLDIFEDYDDSPDFNRVFRRRYEK